MYCISSSLIHSMLYLFASFSTRYLYVYLINARQAKKAINFFLYMFRRNFFPECCMFLLLNFTALHLVIKWRRHHQIRVFFQFRCFIVNCFPIILFGDLMSSQKFSPMKTRQPNIETKTKWLFYWTNRHICSFIVKNAAKNGTTSCKTNWNLNPWMKLWKQKISLFSEWNEMNIYIYSRNKKKIIATRRMKC